ncbi:hypothetical protein Tco_0621177 [Tanacetum coccineum]
MLELTWNEGCKRTVARIRCKAFGNDNSRSTDVVGMALPVQNINHSAFRSMFKKEKLSGNDWFARLKLVLRVEKKMYVIEQPLPPAPEPVAEPNIVAQWTTLYDAHTEIACLMLGSMTPDLHRQFELHYPYDMIKRLRSMFEKQLECRSLTYPNLFMLAKKRRDMPDKLEQRSLEVDDRGREKAQSWGEDLKEMIVNYFNFPPKNKNCVARYANSFEKRLINGRNHGGR